MDTPTPAPLPAQEAAAVPGAATVEAAAAEPATGAAAGPPPEHRLGIRFVGSGSEYFRIWIVNLLLTLVTLGLYYPFAKVRRLRYFHNATEVGGQALSFHGDPWKMLRGHLLMVLLFAAYGVAGRLSPAAGLFAFGVLAALWPWLWHSAMRFRLANTGWRGLRARFTGSVAGAYAALLPSFALGAAFVALGLQVEGPGAAAPGQPPLLPLGLMAVSLLVFPAIFWFAKRYQHNHYALAQEATRFTVRPWGFYKLSLKAAGLLVVVAGALGGLAVLLLRHQFSEGQPDPDSGRWFAWLPLGLMVIVQSLFLPYLATRTQNLVWNGTRSTLIQFESRLRFRAMWALTLRNWLCILFTLGLYFPFARVALARLRLEAVSLVLHADPDTLLAPPRSAADDSTGDAAADLLGLDIGL